MPQLAYAWYKSSDTVNLLSGCHYSVVHCQKGHVRFRRRGYTRVAIYKSAGHRIADDFPHGHANGMDRLKGQRREISLSGVISPKMANWPSYAWSKAVSNIDSNLPRYSTFYILPHYGPLQRLWWCALVHWGEFGDAPWVTAANLVLCCRPLSWIWLFAVGHYMEYSRTVKICDDLRTVGHSAEFSYGLWATVQDFGMRYGP
jgi:hypothetical protein